MNHAAPPPLCRADRVAWTLGAQGATQGQMLSVGVASKHACRLPARPNVQVLVGGRVAEVKRHAFALGAEEVPRRTIGPGRSAWAIVRSESWCGPPGRVSLRLTLGGVSVVRRVSEAQPPVCTTPTGSLGISVFVRR